MILSLKNTQLYRKFINLFKEGNIMGVYIEKVMEGEEYRRNTMMLKLSKKESS